ncbi:MAG: OmpA family protein [Methylococcales bacterium]
MFRKFLLTVLTLSGVSFLPIAHADKVVDDRWYIAPFGTFVQPGGDRQSDNGWGGGLGFGKILNEHFNVELKGFYQNLSDGKYGGSDITGGTADIQYYISRDTFSPYTVIGIGGVNTSHNGKSAAGFIGEAGAGLAYEVCDNFLVRSDVRYRYNNNGNANLQPGTGEFNDVLFNLGFVVPFGEKPKAVVAEATPIIAPAPVAVVKADCSVLDSDHDGVNDCKDQCPNTLPGVKVSVAGCWIVDVKFDNDKDIIKPQYFANLDNVATRIKEHPELVIEVQGHTSKTGGFKHNMSLSERRAIAVKKYLVDGSQSPNLSTHGYGWTRPIDSNDTEAGRANNRRVQLEVNGQAQQPLNSK